MGFAVINGELVHTSRLGGSVATGGSWDVSGGLGDDMQDMKRRLDEMTCWADECFAEHLEDIAHVHITITLSDGTKKDYMQGDAASAGIDDRGLIGGPIGKALFAEPVTASMGLGNLADQMAEDIMSLSDEEVLAEAKEDGMTEANIAGLRGVLGRALNGDFSPPTDQAPDSSAELMTEVRRQWHRNLSQDHTGEYHVREPRR